MTTRTADHAVDPMFLERWSPRAFTAEPIPDETLMSLFEAARWAPSSFNTQPWRFVYAKRDTPAWDRLFALLVPGNQAWVVNASVLMFIVSDRFRHPEGQEPQPNYSHSFDAGAAWAYLALEASRIGWAAHGMTGFDAAAAYPAMEIPEDRYRVEAGIAVGRRGDPEVLPERYRPRETPNGRNPVDGFIFEGVFKA